MTEWIPPWGLSFFAHMKRFGPLPRNFKAVERKGVVIYRNEYGDEDEDYPLSPKGRESGIALDDEIPDPRQDAIGAFYPQFTYKASEWLWKPFGHHAGALFYALNLTQAKKNNDKVAYGQVAADLASLGRNSTGTTLWHPADRSTPIFEHEEKVADVARSYGRSVIVVCPRLARTDQWDHCSSPDPFKRPPVYARWSTGEQAYLPPIVLGCIPARNKLEKRRVYWFALEPLAKPNAVILKSIPSDFWNTLKTRVLFPDRLPLPFLQWVMVAAHYAVVWCPGSVTKDQIGNWMHQYGKHILRTRTTGGKEVSASLFVFNPDKDFSGQGVPFTVIHDIIALSGPGSRIHNFAQQWDMAIEEKIKYIKMNKSDDDDWKRLNQIMGRVSYRHLWE